MRGCFVVVGVFVCVCGFCLFLSVVAVIVVVVVGAVKTGLNELQVKSRASLLHSKENMGTMHE